jgi:NADH-quinone oxidoreductase subunit G
MTFKYGAADSFYAEPKNHREEQKWSPVVYFDRPRCILCYRCVRMCGEGMDIFALGIQNRGSSSVIAPNIPVSESPDGMPALDCEQCGMCIDACPVGALTSGTYRYKTRPWEMNHVATVCTHCGDGCKTTLGVRSVSDGSEIVRGDNRDKSGMNGDFLCNKGRYAFDFANNIERLTSPLIRRSKDTKLVPVSWEEALTFAGTKLRELRDAKGASSIGVIGSSRTTNEENYLLQKFARTVIGTNNIDHHRTADYVTLATALQGRTNAFASQHCVEKAPAVLLIGGDPTNEAPLTAWNLRTNVRLNRMRLYVANHKDIKLKRQAKAFAPVAEFGYAAFIDSLHTDNEFAKAVLAEEKLVVVVGNELRGGELAKLIAALPSAKFALLADYANSRGASDMGVLPDVLPGYQSLKGSTLASEYGVADAPGLDLLAMFDAAGAGTLSALYVVGSNPVKRFGIDPATLKNTFLIVQDMFLTDTAVLADVVLPAANLYEKAGSVTNSYGDLQLVSKAADKAGVRSDFELIVRLADKFGHDVKTLVPFGKGLRAAGMSGDMGQTRGAQSGEADRHSVWLTAQNLELKLSPFDPFAILDEIQRVVPGYDKLLRLQLLSGNDQHIVPASSGLVQIDAARKDLVLPAADTLFTSGSLTRYSPMLQDVQRHQANEVAEPLASAD